MLGKTVVQNVRQARRVRQVAATLSLVGGTAGSGVEPSGSGMGQGVK